MWAEPSGSWCLWRNTSTIQRGLPRKFHSSGIVCQQLICLLMLFFSPQSIPLYYHFVALPAQCFPEVKQLHGEGRKILCLQGNGSTEQAPVISEDIVQPRSWAASVCWADVMLWEFPSPCYLLIKLCFESCGLDQRQYFPETVDLTSNKKLGKLPGEVEQKGDFHSPKADELTADKVPSAS